MPSLRGSSCLLHPPRSLSNRQGSPSDPRAGSAGLASGARGPAASRLSACGARRLPAWLPAARYLPPRSGVAQALSCLDSSGGGSAKERGGGGGRPALEAAPGGGGTRPFGSPWAQGGARGCAVRGQENLAVEMRLSAEQVYNWFANYRRRRRALLQRRAPVPEDAAVDLRVREAAPERPQPPDQPRLDPGGAARPRWPGERLPRRPLCPARFPRLGPGSAAPFRGRALRARSALRRHALVGGDAGAGVGRARRGLREAAARSGPCVRGREATGRPAGSQPARGRAPGWRPVSGARGTPQ